MADEYSNDNDDDEKVAKRAAREMAKAAEDAAIHRAEVQANKQEAKERVAAIQQAQAQAVEMNRAARAAASNEDRERLQKWHNNEARQNRQVAINQEAKERVAAIQQAQAQAVEMNRAARAAASNEDRERLQKYNEARAQRAVAVQQEQAESTNAADAAWRKFPSEKGNLWQKQQERTQTAEAVAVRNEKVLAAQEARESEARKYLSSSEGKAGVSAADYQIATQQREQARADITSQAKNLGMMAETAKAKVESNKAVAAAEVVGGGVVGGVKQYFKGRAEAAKTKEYEKYGAVYKPFSDKEIEKEQDPLQKKAMLHENITAKQTYLQEKRKEDVSKAFIKRQEEETRSKIKTQQYKEAAKWGAISLKQRRDVGSRAEMMRTTAEIERKQQELDYKLHGGSNASGLSAPSDSSMLGGGGVMSGGMMSRSPIAIGGGGGFGGGGYGGGVSPPRSAQPEPQSSQPSSQGREVRPSSGNSALDSLQAPGGHQDAISRLQYSGNRGPVPMPSRPAQGAMQKANPWASLTGPSRSDTFASLSRGNTREDPYATVSGRPSGRENAFASLTGGKANDMKVDRFSNNAPKGDGWANLARPSGGGGMGGLSAPPQKQGDGWGNLARGGGGGLGGLTAPPQRQGDPFANLSHGGGGLGGLAAPGKFENSLGSGWKKLTMRR